MNIITGCLSATTGTVTVDGHDIFEEPNAAKRCIGYLPEHPPLYLSESVLEYLRFVGEVKGLKKQELEDQIDLVLEKTGTTEVQNRRIGDLSKGYRQRVGIAQALLGNPKVIILDEPTVGLDPIQIIEIRDLIKSLGKTHTVIFSSHILSEVQAICDQILMIAHGRLVAFGEPEALQRQLLTGQELLIRTDGSEEAVKAALGDLTPPVTPDITPEEGTARCCVHIRTEGDMDTAAEQAARSLVEHGLPVFELTQKKGSLEDVFLELTEQKEEAVS